MSAPPASARIDAAAVEGDLASALDVLDLLNNTGVPIDIVHISSALRACKGAEGERHKAAMKLYELAKGLQLQPNIVTFTSLIGCLADAPLTFILSSYNAMKGFGIQPNKVFAETFLTTVLGRIPRQGGAQSILTDILPHQPPERVAAVREALADFKKADVKLTRLSSSIEVALLKWRQD